MKDSRIFVNYIALYESPDFEVGKLFTRSLDDWNRTTKVVEVPRFQPATPNKETLSFLQKHQTTISNIATDLQNDYYKEPPTRVFHLQFEDGEVVSFEEYTGKEESY